MYFFLYLYVQEQTNKTMTTNHITHILVKPIYKLVSIITISSVDPSTEKLQTIGI
jgi:hypothetical protein